VKQHYTELGLVPPDRGEKAKQGFRRLVQEDRSRLEELTPEEAAHHVLACLGAADHHAGLPPFGAPSFT